MVVMAWLGEVEGELATVGNGARRRRAKGGGARLSSSRHVCGGKEVLRVGSIELK